MKPTVLKSDKNLLKLELEQLDQGILSAIKAQLWEDKATELAGFQTNHPEVDKPVFTLRTKGKDPKKVWNAAIAELKKQADSLSKEAKKIK
jgi:DNA-directed RNA polymerase subunit L